MSSQEHILVCLSSAPSNARIIRTAARMAQAYQGRFTALFIQTPDYAAMTVDNKKRLQAHCRLAQQLGASVETVYGEDVAFQIAEFARLSGVTMVVLGRSALTRKHLLGKLTLTEQLSGYVPELDIHIIPNSNQKRNYRPRKVRRIRKWDVAVNTGKSLGILAGATLLSLLFYHMGFTDSNIIMVYILGVLLTSVVTSHQLYSLVSSVSSVLIFNYLFTLPRFSFTAYETGYPMTFLVMFMTAYITGTLALRYKEQAKQSAKNAYRTQTLFDTNRLLSKASTNAELLAITGKQLVKLLQRDVVVYEVRSDHSLSDNSLAEPVWYGTESGVSRDPERAVAEWVATHNHAAGAGTSQKGDAGLYFLSIRFNDNLYGVVGIVCDELPLEASENGMVLSILGEAALVLESNKNLKEKEEAALLAEREQLRANLLRTISHDLRTPLTSISGNATNLLLNDEVFDPATKHQIYQDIYTDAMWLINLVENLLYATRIEDGRMVLKTEPELVTEMIGEAVQHCEHQHGRHTLVTDCPDELLLVRADAKLIVQVLVNLIDNAVKYTPVNTTITVRAAREGDVARISVIDNGPGIPDAEKEKVFEMFYTGSNRIPDNRRSLGLGLYLCKAIVEAHGGTIGAFDNNPHGAQITFTLPIEEATLHE